MLAGLSARLWAALAAVAAAVAVVAGAFLRGRQSGIDSARARAAEEAKQQRNTRDAIDRAVARDPDPAAELRRDWRRP